MALRPFLVLALLGACAASVYDLCAEQTSIQVETMVFSGTPNPIFTLSGSEWQSFCAIVQQVNASTLKLPTCRVLGFTGWRLCSSQNAKDCAILMGAPRLDEALFLALSDHLPGDAAAAMGHIHAELHRAHLSDVGDLRCAGEEPPPPPTNAACQAPIVGPDDATQVHFDPSNDDKGCFTTEQNENNCYDYGNDIVTNTFAQPGRGSGVCPPNTRPCVKNTCEAVKAAAVSDGLTWVGTDLPTSLPSKGHYVSLHIWPKTNFHWLRMDADMYWSHKPGGSSVRNVDNNHKKIHDPAKADVSPWSDHCGYLLSVPSTATIKMKLVEPFMAV